MTHVDISFGVVVRFFIIMIAAFLVDVGYKTQLQFMWSIRRRQKYIWTYSFGPWQKLVLMGTCVVTINTGLIFPSLPDDIMEPAVIVTACAYLVYAMYIYNEEMKSR